jgi:predicted dehydrogenase
LSGEPKMIRWGIVGCGDVTEVKSGPALQQADGSALVAVMRRDGEKARDYAGRHNVARWYDDADALIADAEVDAVYVATPPSSHLELAMKVAAAGKPCLVEKPMARTGEECRQMVEAFERAGVPLFVAYYRRALPAFVRVRQLVDAGTLGTITSVSSRFSRPPSPDAGWRIDPDVSGGGLFVDLASHALNALEWIAGDFVEPQGRAVGLAHERVEDVVTLQWRCAASGALGYAAYNFASAVSEDVLEITGTKARVSWACFGDGTVAIAHADGRVEIEKHPPPRHVHGPLVQAIVDELRGRGRSPSDGISGMRTSVLIDVAIGEFYRSKR